MATMITLTNTDPDFYPVMGPYLASRQVHRHLGGPLWDDDHKTWLILRDNDGVAGFVGVTETGKRTVVESLWTRPSAPTTTGAAGEASEGPEGVEDAAARRLVAAAVHRYGHDRDLHTIVRKAHAAAYIAAGFTPVGETKEFTKMIRRADIRG